MTFHGAILTPFPLETIASISRAVDNSLVATDALLVSLTRTRELDEAQDPELDPDIEPEVAEAFEESAERATNLHILLSRLPIQARAWNFLMDFDGARDEALAHSLALHGGYDPDLAYSVDKIRKIREELKAVSESLHADLRLRSQAQQITAKPVPDTPILKAPERLLRLATRLLPSDKQARYLEEFRAELVHLPTGRFRRWTQLRYAASQTLRIFPLRGAILKPAEYLGERLHRLSCWILATDLRTWGLLGPLMAFAIVNVFLQQGWGSAFFTVPAVVAFYAGVEWLRTRWGVEVKRRRRKGSSVE